MQLNIPQNAEAFVMGKAAAAGFTDVTEYVNRLIAKGGERKAAMPIDEPLEDLRKLRSEVPKMTSAEIVQLVAEGRPAMQ